MGEDAGATRARIEIKSEGHLVYWTDTLRCSAEELRRAVEAVGSARADVVDYLAGLRARGSRKQRIVAGKGVAARGRASG